MDEIGETAGRDAAEPLGSGLSKGWRGQIVFQAVEWLKGSPLSERAQAFGQQVGIALLILLMGVALFNDIARQFS